MAMIVDSRIRPRFKLQLSTSWVTWIVQKLLYSSELVFLSKMENDYRQHFSILEL